MTIKIKQLTLGIAGTNAYIVGDTNTQEAVLIDPVDEAETLFKAAQDEGLTIKLILATHGHFDHILASKALKELTNAPFYIHEDCVEWLDRLPSQGQFFGLQSFPEAATPDRLLSSDSEDIHMGNMHFRTLYTPGHAPGHLSFYMPSERLVFSGDSLFAGSIGRVDLPGGDYHLLMRSITTQLMTLDDDVRILPGHMQISTIGRERQTNPYLLSYDPSDEDDL